MSLDQKIEDLKAKVTVLKTAHPKWRDEPVAEVDECIAQLKAAIKEKADAEKAAKKAATPAPAKPAAAASASADDDKALLALQAKKDTDFSAWYLELIYKAELISSYSVSGCYILRPWSFFIWEQIQHFMNAEFSKRGVQNCYFPMFVTEAALNKEEAHVEGFTAEVAWITKSGKTDLKEKIAVRPTSETVMYPAYSEWIRSHRDLPLKLNQWCNVVRWEFKSPTPFLRTREFLWQEGHTAFATKAEADAEVYDILDVYERTYADLLAVPTIKGTKTETEKFPGGDFTTTVEAYIPYAGRGIQGATSHGLGQNFAKMFDVTFESATGARELAWQNSWGFTTRSIGVAIMVHGDDIGLVLPPKIAKIQAIFVPIIMTGQKEAVFAACAATAAQLAAAGIRVDTDLSEMHNSGFKRSHWEQKGVPLRIEIGPKDLAKNSVLMCVRDTAEKRAVAVADLAAVAQKELVDMHARLLAKATAFRDAHISDVTSWSEFLAALDKRHLVLAPFCNTSECEEEIKQAQKQQGDDDTIQQGNEQFQKITASAKSLCIPKVQKPLDDGQKCFRCTRLAKVRCLFGRSF